MLESCVEVISRAWVWSQHICFCEAANVDVYALASQAHSTGKCTRYLSMCHYLVRGAFWVSGQLL